MDIVVMDGVEIERTEEMIERHFMSLTKRRLLKEFWDLKTKANTMIRYTNDTREDHVGSIWEELRPIMVLAYQEDYSNDPTDKELIRWISENVFVCSHYNDPDWGVWIDLRAVYLMSIGEYRD